MRTIEIAGAVGAGKTSVIAPLQALLSARGSDVMTVDAAVARVGASASIRLVAAARFAATHPRLLILVARALLRAPIAWWHRRRILLLIMKLGMRLEVLRTRVPAASIVLVDEGWLQRALNLFAWRVDAPTAREIEAYLDRAPLSEAIVFVEAPPAVMRDRAIARGLPRRLRGRSTEEIDAFLEHGRDVLDRSLASLGTMSRGVRVVRVANDRGPEDVPELLARALAHDPVARPRVHRPAWPSLARPDRILARTRRLSGVIPSEVAVDVAVRAGLADPKPADGGVSPGGRGMVRAVRDAEGGTWLVKRYKESLADADIALEHTVLRRLAELGLPAPRLHAGHDGGESVVRTGEGRFAVYRFAAGYEHPHERMYWPSDRRALDRLAGQVLSGLHDGLCGFDPPAASENGFSSRAGPHVRPIAGFVDRLASWRHTRGAGGVVDADGREWMAAELLRLDAVLDTAGLSRTVIHGDYGPYNLLVRGGREPIAIDWELARLDWRLTDLATALPRFAQRRTGWDAGAAERFLAGYGEGRGFDRDELSLLPAVAEYLALRRAVVCIERSLASDDRRWERQANERLRLARTLATGRHPMAQVGRQ